jgi:hypothetical protein
VAVEFGTLSSGLLLRHVRGLVPGEFNQLGGAGVLVVADGALDVQERVVERAHGAGDLVHRRGPVTDGAAP